MAGGPGQAAVNVDASPTGGSLTLRAGAGGLHTRGFGGGATGGPGGTLALAGGVGGEGTDSSATTNAGGLGGPITLTGGVGGAASGSNAGGTFNSGAGGTLTFVGGAGGAASGASGTQNGGAGGNLVLGSGAGGVGTDTTGAAGTIQFKIAATESARFDISSNFGIGTGSTVSARLHAISTTEQLRIGYDASNYYSTTVSSAGAITLDAVGASALFTFSDVVKAAGYQSSDGSAGGTGAACTEFKNGLCTAASAPGQSPLELITELRKEIAALRSELYKGSRQ